MTRNRDGRQQELPFGLAEANRDGRRSRIMGALDVVRCDLFLREFCLKVFEWTNSGLDGELIMSYQDLARIPDGLCCSVSKARSTVEKAKRFRLVHVRDLGYASGVKRANGYSIDWEGVRSYIRFYDGLDEDHPEAAVSTKQVPVSTKQVPVSTKQVPVSTKQHIKETTLLKPFFEETRTGPGADPPSVDLEDGSEANARGVYGAVAVSPPGTAVSVPDFFHEARSRTIEPLECEPELACGVFHAIEERHLRSIGELIHWFRQQLAALEPATDNTEADLLFVLAAAKYALSIPRAELRRNYQAVFNDVVARERMTKARPYLPDARATLDRHIEHFGRQALLCGSIWPPRPLAAGDDDKPP